MIAIPNLFGIKVKLITAIKKIEFDVEDWKHLRDIVMKYSMNFKQYIAGLIN